MCTGQTTAFVFAGLALLVLVSAESIDDNTAKSLYKLLQPSYDTAVPDKRGSDLDFGYDSAPDLNWGSAPLSSYNFGSFIRRPPPSYRRNLIEDKRFGYVGSRGKRMDRSGSFMTLRDLLDMYEEKARALPFRSSAFRPLSNQDSTVLNSKRQPHFGFHGVRG